MKAGACGERIVVGGAVLGELRCAEDAEGDVSGERRWKLVEQHRCTRMRAAQR
jgi:hypothetical protein